MPIKDIFLPLVGEPNVSALAAIEKCVAVAANLGARITAVAVEQDIVARPKVVISADLDNAAETEALRSVTDAKSLLKAFESDASRVGVRAKSRLRKVAPQMVVPVLAECARFSDLTLIPVKSHDSRTEAIVEALLFESGRPLLLCPEDRAGELRPTFGDVMIAWDSSARAARAVGDALPILQEANSVRLVTVTDEKSDAIMQSGTQVLDHLREHGVFAEFETVPIDGSSIGKVLANWAHLNGIDTIVMGAYRHSRLNENIWGGVTKTLLGEPPCWVMMSH